MTYSLNTCVGIIDTVDLAEDNWIPFAAAVCVIVCSYRYIFDSVHLSKQT